ncbi:WD40 repeat-like protein [Peniophora sp. CONT]|nr:WD40 repeat-like protein [Peniophora sp. CONT]
MIGEVAKMRTGILNALDELRDSQTTSARESKPRMPDLRSKILHVVNWVDSADIDAQNSNGCLEGTRVDILAELSAWSRDIHAPRIYWLNGMAGVGKSAIARSFCHELRKDGLLGGSFFCSRRGTVEQADAKRIIPSLAVLMALRDVHCAQSLLAELDFRPYSPHWNYEVQVEHLLRGPFCGIHSEEHPLPVVVIDALDECSDENATRDLLLELVKSASLLPMKFFLTSRPELHIRRELERLHDAPSLGKVLRLHDIEMDIVSADISLYLTHGLRALQPSAPNWPQEADIAILTQLSGKLFIYAFTVLMYLRDNPIERLEKLTGTVVTAGQVMTRSLDDIYRMILREAMDLGHHEHEEIDLTRRMLSINVFLRHPLKVVELASLLNIPVHRVKSSLDRLHAVIYVPIRDDHGCLSTFHASFGDFLATPGRAPSYMHRYTYDVHTHLADACIQTLHKKLSFNMSRKGSSYLPNTEQVHTLRDDALHYASLHWSYHAVRSCQAEVSLFELEKIFAGPRFLFWLEVLSAFSISAQASEILQVILDCHDHASPHFLGFLEDGIDFVTHFGPAIAYSAPHIYISALAFCPNSSAIRRVCAPYFSRLPRLLLRGPSYSDQNLSGPAIFMPDGKHILVGFSDGELRAWDTEFGAPTSTFSGGHTCPITCVAVSLDGLRVATGSADNIVCIWDMRSSVGLRSWDPQATDHARHLRMKFPSSHEDGVRLLHFSPDGYKVASGLGREVYILNAMTGAPLCPILGSDHVDLNSSVAFSPNSEELISGTETGTMQLWDTNTGLLIWRATRTEHGHFAHITSVRFAADGRQVLSVASNGTVCVWDTRGGYVRSIYRPLNCGLHWIMPPPNELLAVNESEDCDLPASLWTKEPHLEPPHGIRTLRPVMHDKSSILSSDIRRVVVGSNTNTIFVWDLETRSVVCGPHRGIRTDDILSVALSSDGCHMLATTHDCGARVWRCDPDAAANPRANTIAPGPSSTITLKTYPRDYPPNDISPSLPSSQQRDIFRLTDEGWIQDVSCKPPRLLVWIPPEKRRGVYLPTMTFILANYPTYFLDFGDFYAHGTRWADCFRGDSDAGR